jgi:hypothetical protein
LNFFAYICLEKVILFPSLTKSKKNCPPIETLRSIPRLQAHAHPAGVAGRQRPHHHSHLLLARQLQRVRVQVNAPVRPARQNGDQRGRRERGAHGRGVEAPLREGEGQGG